MSNPIDITPEESVTPVYIVEETQESIDSRNNDLLIIQELEEKENQKKNDLLSALEKLKQLGLTEQEAKAIVGV